MKIEQRSNIESFIQIGADITGGTVASLLGFLVAGPPGAIMGSVVSPLVTKALLNLGEEVSNQVMGPKERYRIATAYSLAVSNIQKRLENGENVRQDNFFDSKEDDRSSAETILEGILIKVKNEHEEKKVRYYSEFLSSVTFDQNIDYNQSITYLKIIDKMSFQQLCIICYFHQIEEIKFNNWTSYFLNNPEQQIYLDFCYDLEELYELKVLTQFGAMSLSGPANGRLSILGKKLFDMMHLSNIDDSDISFISEKINLLNEISE